MDHLHDHIWAILIAFLASLGGFIALAAIGSDTTPTGKLGDVVVALAGVIGGYAYRSGQEKKADVEDETSS